jgi:hypothetical protein
MALEIFPYCCGEAWAHGEAWSCCFVNFWSWLARAASGESHTEEPLLEQSQKDMVIKVENHLGKNRARKQSQKILESKSVYTCVCVCEHCYGLDTLWMCPQRCMCWKLSLQWGGVEVVEPVGGRVLRKVIRSLELLPSRGISVVLTGPWLTPWDWDVTKIASLGPESLLLLISPYSLSLWPSLLALAMMSSAILWWSQRPCQCWAEC